MLLRSRRARWLCFVCLLLPATVWAQADTTDYDVETSFKVYPTPIWSRSAGLAAGVGYEIEHLVFPKTTILAIAKPGQHLGRYSLSYFVRDAYEDIFYGAGTVYFEKSGREWYYGMNSTSSNANEVAVEKDMLVAEIKVGVRPLNGLLLFQPSIEYLRHEVYGFRIFDEGAVDRMSPLSQRYLFYSTEQAGGSSSVQEGIAVGISTGLDLTDRPVRTRKGIQLQAAARRYVFDATDVRFDRYEGYGYAYVPISDNVLKLRLVLKITDPKSDVPIPFYLHPTLDGRLLPGYSRNRFFANDLLVATAEYALPLFQFLDFAAMDAVISLGAGNVYLDLVRQFQPAISFKKEIEEGSNYPLRPSAALGFNIQSFDAGAWDMRVLLGWGTEGARLVEFGFVHDLRDFGRQPR